MPLTGSHAARIPVRALAVGLLAAGLLAFALTADAWHYLRWGDTYADLVAGDPALHGADKARDFRVAGLFAALTTILAVAYVRLWRRYAGPEGPEAARPVVEATVYALAPAVWWLATRASLDSLAALPGALAAPVATTWLAAALAAPAARELDGNLRARLVRLAALVPPAGFFAGLGVATVLVRALPAAGDWTHVLGFLPWIGAGAGLIAVAGACTGVAGRAGRRLEHTLLAAQTGWPLLFAVLLPAPLVLDGKRVPSAAGAPLAVLVLGLVVLAWTGILARSWVRGTEAATSVRPCGRLIGGLALAAVAVFLAMPAAHPPAFNADHFHVGEELLPWHQLVAYGKLPYVDFMPIHAALAYVKGLLNALFFDGTAAGFGRAVDLLYGVQVLGLVLVLRPLVGAPLALLSSLCAPDFWNADRVWMVPVFVLVLFHPRLWRRRSAWLAVGALVLAVLAVWNPPVGLPAAAAILPLLLWRAWAWARERPRRAAKVCIGFAAILAAVMLLTPIGQMLVGLAVFVQEHAATNALANGIAYAPGHSLYDPRFRISPLILELVRFGFVGVAAVAAAAVWLTGRERREADALRLWLAVIAFLLLVLISPYALGRIDPGSLSRPGMVTFVALGALLPAVLFAGRGRPRARIVCVAALAAGFLGGLQRMDTRVLEAVGGKACAKHVLHLQAVRLRPWEGQAGVPGRGEVRLLADPKRNRLWVRGEDLDLPRLGRLFIEAEELTRLLELKAALSDLLGAEETYFDLTNQQAYYFYLDRPAPAPYAAAEPVANTATQRRVLAALQADPPPAVLFETCDTLRNYRLYRWCVLRYVAEERQGVTFLVAPERSVRQEPRDAPARLALLDEAAGVADCGAAAAVWGRNWPALARLFVPQAKLPGATPRTIQGMWLGPQGRYVATDAQRGALEFGLDSLHLRGREADFLVLRFAKADPSRMPQVLQRRLEVTWTDASGRQGGPIACEAYAQTLLIPLGASPRWLLSGELATLRIEFPHAQVWAGTRLLEAELVRLRSVAGPAGAARAEGISP